MCLFSFVCIDRSSEGQLTCCTALMIGLSVAAEAYRDNNERFQVAVD